MRHIAVEGRCFVLSACQYLTRADCPADYEPIQGSDPATVLIRGGSGIVGPLGEEIVAPVYGREAVLAADLDLRQIPRAKFDFDVVGHYARPDIFELRVDRRAHSLVKDEASL
jgi:nitrilase